MTVVPTLLRAITEEVNCPRDEIFRLHDFREIASFKRKEISTHTKWQRELYPITPIVRARVFESNEAGRASQNANHTSRSPFVVEFGQPANVAAQPKLGLLPERGPRAGSGNPARIVASWKNLKLATCDEGQQQKEKYWPRRVWFRKYCSVRCMGLQLQ